MERRISQKYNSYNSPETVRDCSIKNNLSQKIKVRPSKKTESNSGLFDKNKKGKYSPPQSQLEEKEDVFIDATSEYDPNLTFLKEFVGKRDHYKYKYRAALSRIFESKLGPAVKVRNIIDVLDYFIDVFMQEHERNWQNMLLYKSYFIRSITDINQDTNISPNSLGKYINVLIKMSYVKKKVGKDTIDLGNVMSESEKVTKAPKNNTARYTLDIDKLRELYVELCEQLETDKEDKAEIFDARKKGKLAAEKVEEVKKKNQEFEDTILETFALLEEYKYKSWHDLLNAFEKIKKKGMSQYELLAFYIVNSEKMKYSEAIDFTKLNLIDYYTYTNAFQRSRRCKNWEENEFSFRKNCNIQTLINAVRLAQFSYELKFTGWYYYSKKLQACIKEVTPTTDPLGARLLYSEYGVFYKSDQVNGYGMEERNFEDMDFLLAANNEESSRKHAEEFPYHEQIKRVAFEKIEKLPEDNWM